MRRAFQSTALTRVGFTLISFGRLKKMDVLEALHARVWPTLGADWDECAQARSDLQSELLRPEVVVLVMRLGLENKYMSVLWAVLKCNVLSDPDTQILMTVQTLPLAFIKFFMEVRN